MKSERVVNQLAACLSDAGRPGKQSPSLESVISAVYDRHRRAPSLQEVHAGLALVPDIVPYRKGGEVFFGAWSQHSHTVSSITQADLGGACRQFGRFSRRVLRFGF